MSPESVCMRGLSPASPQPCFLQPWPTLMVTGSVQYINRFHVVMACSVIDHRWCQNELRAKKCHIDQPYIVFTQVSLIFFTTFDIFYDLLLYQFIAWSIAYVWQHRIYLWCKPPVDDLGGGGPGGPAPSPLFWVRNHRRKKSRQGKKNTRPFRSVNFYPSLRRNKARVKRVLRMSRIECKWEILFILPH